MGFRRRLLVLDKAHSLLLDVNRTAPGIRRAHHQPIKRQLVKSALSVSSCISEGRAKSSEREFVRFLEIALGSSGELESQLKVATECDAIPVVVGNDLKDRAAEVSKMLHGLIKKIRVDLGDNPK